MQIYVSTIFVCNNRLVCVRIPVRTNHECMNVHECMNTHCATRMVSLFLFSAHNILQISFACLTSGAGCSHESSPPHVLKLGGIISPSPLDAITQTTSPQQS